MVDPRSLSLLPHWDLRPYQAAQRLEGSALSSPLCNVTTVQWGDEKKRALSDKANWRGREVGVRLGSAAQRSLLVPLQRRASSKALSRSAPEKRKGLGVISVWCSGTWQILEAIMWHLGKVAVVVWCRWQQTIKRRLPVWSVWSECSSGDSRCATPAALCVPPFFFFFFKAGARFSP